MQSRINTLNSFLSSILVPDSKIFTLTYLALSLIVAGPVLHAVWGFLYFNDVPAGGDPGDHVFFIERIASTGNLLIAYSQFSDLTNSTGVGYYPSFFHIIIAGISYITSFGSISFPAVLESMNAFMFIQYVIGISGYALLLKYILFDAINNRGPISARHGDGFKYAICCYSILVISFGLFIFSTSPIIKTFRDGGYGEIFAMWCIFPFYLYFLLHKRWFVSALLLAVICSTHNLAFILTLIATVAYFIKLLINKEFNTLWKSKKFLIASLLFCMPAFIFFYLPSIATSLNSGTGVNSGLGVPESLSKSDIADQVTPGLYYFGVVGLIGLTVLDYKRLSWITVWLLLYFPIFNSSILAIRFSREISVPLGIIIGLFSAMVTYEIIFNLFGRYNHHSNNRGYIDKFLDALQRKRPLVQSLACIATLLIALGISFDYFQYRIEEYSNKDILNYYTPTYALANKYLSNLNRSPDAKDSILSFGVNPWLKPYLFGKYLVLEAVPREDEMTLSRADRSINDKLLSVFENPTSPKSKQTLEDLNIKYVLVSTPIPDRWYPPSFLHLAPALLNFQPDFDSNDITFYKGFTGTLGEEVRLYAVNVSKIS
jgi:hypothetical protein